MTNKDEHEAQGKIDNVLASVDEKELKELSEADAYGGSTAPCTIRISVLVCPTLVCTSEC